MAADLLPLSWGPSGDYGTSVQVRLPCPFCCFFFCSAKSLRVYDSYRLSTPLNEVGMSDTNKKTFANARAVSPYVEHLFQRGGCRAIFDFVQAKLEEHIVCGSIRKQMILMLAGTADGARHLRRMISAEHRHIEPSANTTLD